MLGQLGRHFQRGRKKYATIPKMVHLDMPIRQVACGALHTAAVTDAGTVWTWGDARCFQLGYEPVGYTNQATPRIVDSLEGHVFITAVACGQSHTVVLSDKGNLIAWGLNKSGQCGQHDRANVRKPKLVGVDDQSVRFVEMSCGDKHTVALSRKGVAYAFGSATQGQLGLGDASDKLKPVVINYFKQSNIVLTSVVCGAIHTAFISDLGNLYVCGFGEHFYPNEDQQNFYYLPCKIPFNERVVQVACGQSHILCLNDKGDVYTFGSGSYGQLGQGVKGDLNNPRLVLAGKSIAQVSAGRYHSLALTSFGALYSWGCGENGQLGHHNDDENVLFPKVIEPNIGTVVGQIACGEHHTAALSSTPWLRSDPAILEWLQSEREEYNLKLKFLKKTNHGLIKKDLILIQDKMAHLRENWEIEKMNKNIEEGEEQKKDIASVKKREEIEYEIKQEKKEREQMRKEQMREQHHQQHSANASGSFEQEEKQEASSQSQDQASHHSRDPSQSDRPDSAPTSLPLSSSAFLPEPPSTASFSGSYTARLPSRPPRKLASLTRAPTGATETQNGSMTARGSVTSTTGAAPGSPQQGGQRASSAGQMRTANGQPILSITAPSIGLDPSLSVSSPTSSPSGFAYPSQPYSARTANASLLGNSHTARAAFLKESSGMVKRMKSIIAESGDTSNHLRLHSTIQSVFGYRKDYDTLRNLTRNKVTELELIQRSSDALKHTNDTSKYKFKSAESLLKSLSMKLSTVTIKITETEENRKNYALNIAHLKEEELERYYQLEGLRKQCSETDAFVRKMNEMKLQALEEQDRAEMELNEFKTEIIEFQTFLGDQLNKFHAISEIANARKMKREAEKQARQAKQREKVDGRIAKLQYEMDRKT